jgi:hypothetical protein
LLTMVPKGYPDFVYWFVSSRLPEFRGELASHAIEW